MKEHHHYITEAFLQLRLAEMNRVAEAFPLDQRAGTTKLRSWYANESRLEGAMASLTPLPSLGRVGQDDFLSLSISAGFPAALALCGAEV